MLVDRIKSVQGPASAAAGVFGGATGSPRTRANCRLDAVLDRRLKKKPGVLMHNGQERTSRS